MTIELTQLELLSNVDDLVMRLTDWSVESSPWEVIQREKLLVRRTIERLEPMRARVEAPLVVATFGGTGVGKSSLVNALVGAEVTIAGRQRPTTTVPYVIAHPSVEVSTILAPLMSPSDDSKDSPGTGQPSPELHLVRSESMLLRDIVLIDCPDPDTNEVETAESNLARLHRLLPFCDVLLYVSTQQKYRSARVGDELLEAAKGCRVVFVQTHAELDEDIRDDWRRHLAGRFDVHDLFFVDSKRALNEQKSGVRPTGEFGRLIDLLHRELSTAQRVRIRKANLLGLVHEVLQHVKKSIAEQVPAVESLNRAMDAQRHRLTERMASRLRDELLVSRGLWEQRLLGQVTQQWGYSPFASVLRLWHSQAGLLASFALTRARTTAQMALIGIVHGSRMLVSSQREQDAERRLEGLASLGLTESELREAKLVIDGHARSAGLDQKVTSSSSIDSIRSAAADVQNEFLLDATRRIDELILRSATRNSSWLIRAAYEVMFAELPLFLLYRMGKNFFYDTFVVQPPLPYLDTSFYIPALLFLLIWAGLLVMAFTGRLRRGLNQSVNELARELASLNVGSGLFPKVEEAVNEFSQQRDRVETFTQNVDSIRDRFSESIGLGGLKSA